jgi:hypothetical protein
MFTKATRCRVHRAALHGGEYGGRGVSGMGQSAAPVALGGMRGTLRTLNPSRIALLTMDWSLSYKKATQTIPVRPRLIYRYITIGEL